MPSQAEQAALTAAYIAQQRLLAAALSRDLVLLVRRIFDVTDQGRSWSATKVALDTLIRERRRESAGLAARYYVNLRHLAIPTALAAHDTELGGAGRSRPQPQVRLNPGTGLPQPRPTSSGERPGPAARPVEAPQPERPREPAEAAERDVLELPEDVSDDDAWAELEKIAPLTPEDIADLNEDRVDANLNATGIASYKKAIRAGQAPEKAVDTMAVNLSGASTTLVLEGGREVIRDAVLADEEAIGWARITDPDPCAFCAMLASRGAVYHSRATAGAAANKKFVGDGMFKFHNHDACIAKPIFDQDDPALEVADDLYERWLRATQGASGQKKMLKAWTEYWDQLDPADKPTTHSSDAAAIA